MVKMKFITITSVREHAHVCVCVCVCVCTRLCVCAHVHIRLHTVLVRCTYLLGDIDQVRLTTASPWKNLGLEVETEVM